MFQGLQYVPGNSYRLYILEYPVNVQDPCDDLEEIYDPDGKLGALIKNEYIKFCQFDHMKCAIGDLTTRHGGFRNFNFIMTRPKSVVGYSLTTRHGGFNSTDGFINFGRNFNLDRKALLDITW